MTPVFRWVRPSSRCPLLLALWLLVAPAGATGEAVSLEEVRAVAAAGAPGLALRLLDGAQPARADDPAAWLAWERERLVVLESRGAWGRLVARVDGYGAGLPADFHGHAVLRAVRAELERGRGAEARRRLRALLWSAPRPAAAEEVRRLVIESYVVDGEAADAFKALLRHRLDFGDGAEAWRRLAARVMVLAGQPDEALVTLEEVAGDEAAFLRLLAQIQAGRLDWEAGMAAVDEVATDHELSAGRHYQLAVALADRAATPAQRVLALERAMTHRRLAGTAHLVAASPKALWDAYGTHARILSNVHQLLIGRFETWLELAATVAEREPVAARSLYAFVARGAEDEVWRRQGETALVAALRALPGGLEVLRQLYLERDDGPEAARLPEAIRYALVEQALAAGDIPLASEMARDLEASPPGGDGFEWPLRRARVLVLGGLPDEGARVLGELLAAHPALAPRDVDRINQVLFELQAVGEPELAYGLFEDMRARVADEQRRREIHYWMAESREAAGQPLAAARLYLRSAVLPGPRVMDPWSRTARYRAAEALAEAGLNDDARNLYETLLAVAAEPERQALLRRAIRRLGLPGSR
ncbi:MAG: hypothetical protein U5S82_11880 [Gammaproteobacteria bacterium]|nr:hypothetical protein [Gammaproteobacteria bacterium]